MPPHATPAKACDVVTPSILGKLYIALEIPAPIPLSTVKTGDGSGGQGDGSLVPEAVWHL